MSRLMEDLPSFPCIASTSQEDHESNSGSTSSRKLRITLLSSEWRSTKGGLSTINRELAIQLAKHSSVEVRVYLPQCSEEDKRVAESHNVQLVEADEMAGYDNPVDWLSSLPEGHAVDCVIGHGAVLGRQVQFIKRTHPHCKWIQVVHTSPEELGMYKEYEENISKGEKKHQVEVKLCKLADHVVAVGPKLAEAFSGYLRPCGKDQNVFNFTPGIFSEFSDVKQATEERNFFNVLVFGRSDNEDFQLKGYDIAAKAIAELKDMTYKLVFVGATSGEEEKVAKMLLQEGVDRSQLRVRCFNESREKLADLFCEVDLAIMPSRTEGFGLAALEALSAGLPVLVSGNSGFGEALKKVPFASSCVVESDDPKEWASAIKVVRHKDREMRLGESKIVRGAYGEKYSWKEQCDILVERMRNIILEGESLDLRFDCNVPEQVDASLPLNVNREQNALDRRIPSSQEVLNLIATKYFETINPSNQEELNGFLQYMEKVRKLILVDVKTGSLIITVRCSSLRILDELWEDYCTGHLNKVAQRYLVTEDFLKELGLDSVQLTLNINEEEYKAYRKHLLKSEVSSFNLEENQTRWVVIGICLNRLLLPVLRDFVGKEMHKHYASLKSAHGIDTQVYGSHLTRDGPFQLNYGSINNNWGNFKKKVLSYDYKVGTAEDLAKLYLEPHMAKFTGFDNTCDLNAVLGILERASVFHTRIQTNAKAVRSKVRNEWGHCNFDHWTEREFENSFHLMETMVRSLGLSEADEDKQLGELHHWETTGLQLSRGCPVDKDLIKPISVEVKNVEKEVDNIRQSSADEANKISAALLIIREEIANFDKRISEIERRMKEERKERLEKEEALSNAIADLSGSLSEVDRLVEVVPERQSNLETTISTVADEQACPTADVGAVKIGQSQLDAMVEGLEKGSYKTTNAKIFQVPSRNHCFCGRDRELEAIATQLKNIQNGCIFSAICGLGGVGKTSVAVEFLWQHRGKYPGGIFWISGESNSIFQRSVVEMARQIGTLGNDFNNSLSKTLDWLRNRDELWCLVIDNLDELEMSKEMRELLTGHWKHEACGHIIITTRREASDIGGEAGMDEQCCIELKCLTQEESIYFLRMRTGKGEGEDNDLRVLVKELGGLPLVLDQAGAYIRWLKQSIKQYLEKYRKQKLLLLKKKKGQPFVENISSERLAVYTTWKLNFNQISLISQEMELGRAPVLLMQVCAFYGPDDIPYELVSELLKEDGSSGEDSSLWDQSEMMSLPIKFSLFQRYGTDSFIVHRLVREVIQSHLEKEQTEGSVLSHAVRVLQQALKNTLSPVDVCESFPEDAALSMVKAPSLRLWGKLASHCCYLQENLRSYSAKHKESVRTLLYTKETVRVFNDAALFLSVSQDNVKAQEIHDLKLDFLAKLSKSNTEEGTELLKYFIDVPLKKGDYKLISYCMRQPAPEGNSVDVSDTSRRAREEKASQIRERGNLAVKNTKFQEASVLYSSAIALSPSDGRLFANRALCYLKLGQPEQALDDCEKCLLLDPHNSKALQRKVWALHDLVKRGALHLDGQRRAALAVAVHIHSSLRDERVFNEMFPEVRTHSAREVYNETQLAFALMTAQRNETLLLHEGEYSLEAFVSFTDVQIVGLGKGATFKCPKQCVILDSRCYFQNINFPKENSSLICQGKKAVTHVRHCEIAGGWTGCKDFPDCNGGPGCIADALGRPVCSRTGKFGQQPSISGIRGFPGVQILNGALGLFENCSIHDCGGRGTLVAKEDSRMEVRKCEVFKNSQSGLEAREGGKLIVSGNRIFGNGSHGISLGPDAGECEINENKIFENLKEGMLVFKNTNKIVIRNNDVHHNRPFGLYLEDSSLLLISDNKIFENGFWGILAKSRISASIRGNVISGNKCGGVFIGSTSPGRIHLESNIVRGNGGPWVHNEETTKDSVSVDERGIPHNIRKIPGKVSRGKKPKYNSKPLVVNGNKVFNNEEGMFHPREVAQRVYSGCTYCHRSSDEVSYLIKCPTCHIASYCSKECQYDHWPKHRTLCIALRSRYSVTVKIIPSAWQGKLSPVLTSGSALKGQGTGSDLDRNSGKKFIVKIQTQTLNSDPLHLLFLCDKSRSLDCTIQRSEIFNVIMECGVLAKFHKFTSKEIFAWAMFFDRGEKLRIFLDHLAPYQEW